MYHTTIVYIIREEWWKYECVKCKAIDNELENPIICEKNVTRSEKLENI